jgi:hypothetical protein
MRISFYQLFRDNGDSSYTPLKTVKIGGAIIGAGIDFTSEAWFGDIEIAKYIGRDFEFENLPDGTLEIRKIY